MAPRQSSTPWTASPQQLVPRSSWRRMKNPTGPFPVVRCPPCGRDASGAPPAGYASTHSSCRTSPWRLTTTYGGDFPPAPCIAWTAVASSPRSGDPHDHHRRACDHRLLAQPLIFSRTPPVLRPASGRRSQGLALQEIVVKLLIANGTQSAVRVRPPPGNTAPRETPSEADRPRRSWEGTLLLPPPITSLNSIIRDPGT
jgi:hypothetical protein